MEKKKGVRVGVEGGVVVENWKIMGGMFWNKGWVVSRGFGGWWFLRFFGRWVVVKWGWLELGCCRI